MSKGFGKIQQKIIEILKYKREKDHKEWYDISSLSYQVVYGIDCWDKDIYLSNPNNSIKQSIYRAIRTLEKKGVIKSKIVGRDMRINWRKKGGAMKRKDIKILSV